MPQSRLPMPKPPDPHASLVQRMQIIDLLTVIMLPGAIGSCAVGMDPEPRVILYVLLFLLSLAAVWWGTTVANTYGVQKAWKRVMLHLYGLAAFTCFLLTVPAFLALFVTLVDQRPWLDFVQKLGLFLFSAGTTASMFVVERRRIRAAELAQQPAPALPPVPPTESSPPAPESPVSPPP